MKWERSVECRSHPPGLAAGLADVPTLGPLALPLALLGPLSLTLTLAFTVPVPVPVPVSLALLVPLSLPLLLLLAVAPLPLALPLFVPLSPLLLDLQTLLLLLSFLLFQFLQDQQDGETRRKGEGRVNRVLDPHGAS